MSEKAARIEMNGDLYNVNTLADIGAFEPPAEALVARTVQEITRGAVGALMPAADRERVRSMSDSEIAEEVRRIFARPQVGYVRPSDRFLMNPALAVQWLTLFESLGLPRDLKLFEPCVGSSEPVIFAAEVYSDGRSEYTSLNLNTRLAIELETKLTNVRSRIRVIQDNASSVAAFLPPASLDVGCFHHAINDILQTAVSEPRGLDTRSIEWWSNERQMIEWLAEDAAGERLGERARPALLSVVEATAHLVRPGGYLLFDHWTFHAHREQPWFPWKLFCDLIPLARSWIAGAALPLREIPLSGRNPRWWMAFQVLEDEPAAR